MKRLKHSVIHGAIALLLGSASVLAEEPASDASSFGQAVTNVDGMTIIYGESYQSDTSLPIYYLPEWKGTMEEQSSEEREAPENWGVPNHHVNAPDTVVQDFHTLTWLPTAPMPAPLLTFNGMHNTCGCAPPDTDGEVGKTQFVQMTNAGYQVFDKATGNSLLGPRATSSIWAGFGGVCENNGRGDPVVLYDQLADRWVITQFAGNPVTDECIAVSTSSDATGSYKRYGFHLGSEFFDYPHLGVWPDGYYMAMNVFNSAGTAFLRPQPFAFDRAAMVAGNATANFVTYAGFGNNVETFLPADFDGTTLPPPGAPNPFVMYPSNNEYSIYRFHADFATPANTTFTLAPGQPASAAFTQPCGSTSACIPTPAGASNYLNGLDDRLMFRLAYRNFGDHESLIGNFTAKANNVAGIRWFELRNVTTGAPTLYQESTYQPDAVWRWIGSVAMDVQGNLALAYSASSATINPQIRYSGRLAGDPLNTLTQTETHLFDGTGSQTANGNRWGDYSQLTVDPVDDCTFWFTSEYSTGGTDWKTRIGSFKFPGCAAQPGFTLAATPASTAVCAGSPAAFTVNVDKSGNYAGTVSLTATGNPANSTATFNPTSVSAFPSSSSLSVTTVGVAAGSYPITINGAGTAGATAQSTSVTLAVTAGNPATANLTAPANAATGVSTSPTFTWAAAANTTSYTLEVASDAAFTTIVKTVANLTATTTSVTGLSASTTYYWRVKAINGCGNTTSSVFSFTTASAAAPLCHTLNLAIPDNSATGVSDSIVVNDPSTLNGLKVSMKITHGYVEDISATLSKGAASSVLIDLPGSPATAAGCNYPNIDVTLDDAAATNAEDACSHTSPAIGGTQKPNNPVYTGRAWAGQPFAGTYTLKVTDSISGITGTLTEWCLIPTLAAAPTYTVGGNVSGLTGSGLVLSLNAGAQTLPVAASGAFTFPTGLANSAAYAVTVGTQPSGQSCTVASGSGTISSANVSNVAVTCTATTTTYTVTPSVTGNGTISPSTPQTVNSGATQAFTLAPTAGNHIVNVTGTCPAGSLSGTTWTTGAIAANCTVFGNFALDTYTVTATSGGNGTITPATQSVNGGSSASFTVTPAANYHVASVIGNTCTVTQGSGNSWSSNAITQNCAVTATFAIDTFTVTATSGGNGTITPATQSVNGGSSASFTVTPAANYHVASVIGNTCTVTQGSGNSWSSNAITQNCAVTATFAIDTFTVTATSGGNGTITPVTQTVNSGTAANFVVNPAASYKVGSVTGDTCTVSKIGGSNWTSSTITQNCAVTATFVPNSHKVGGTVSGLLGNSVTLSLNSGAQTLAVSNNGTFQFTNDLADGATYAVTVSTSPTGPIETCSVSNGSGTATADVSNVQVSCIDVIFKHGFESP